MRAIDPPWIEIDGPDEKYVCWAWYCACSGYDIVDTEDEAIREGSWHGNQCDKGKYRYEQWTK